MVDQRLIVVEVTSKFGSYVKFAVKCEDEPQPTSVVMARLTCYGTSTVTVNSQ